MPPKYEPLPITPEIAELVNAVLHSAYRYKMATGRKAREIWIADDWLETLFDTPIDVYNSAIYGMRIFIDETIGGKTVYCRRRT